MKKLLLTLCTLLVSATQTHAALEGNGYYRVNNYASGRYIYVEDNKGSVETTAMTADMAAIELWKTPDRKYSDPASIIYFDSKGGTSYDLIAQGTSVHGIVGLYVSVMEYPAGSKQYLCYATSNSLTKYLCDSEKNTDLDKGCIGDNGSGDWRKWQITPVSSSSSDSYFGVLPQVKAGNTNYATFYASFPFSFASSGLEAYTISKVENGMAVLKKVSGVIPAATPVLIKCAGSTPASNKLNLGGSASAISGNLLKGVYFNNSSKSHNNQTAYNSSTMRVLGLMSDGSLGFVTTTAKYLEKNRAYLTVPAGSPEQIKVVTEEEYNNSFVTVAVKSADSKQGTVYVNTSGTTSVKVAKGSSVTLNATPIAPYQFSNWTLDGKQVSTTASYNVKADANATYTANFKLSKYAVTLSATNGTLSATAGSAALVSGQSYDHGTQITITKAQPNDGYEFSSLKVGDKDVTSDFKTNGKYTFSLSSAVTVTATFTKIPDYILTLSAPNGKLTVVSGGKEVTSGTSLRRGTAVTITSAVAAEGYELTGLKVNSTDVLSSFVKNGKYDFTITEATTVTASFTKIPEYPVVIDSEHGTVMIESNGNKVASDNLYRRDTKMTITSVMAYDGYELTALTINDKDILDSYLRNEKYDFTVTEPTVVVAVFSKIPDYSITLRADHGTIVVYDPSGHTVKSGQIYRRDTELVIKELTVDEGWRIVGLSLNNQEILGSFNNSPDGYAFNITEDVVIDVEYVEVVPDPEPRVYHSTEGSGRMIVSLDDVSDPELAEALESGKPLTYNPDGQNLYIYLLPADNMMVGYFIVNGITLEELDDMGLVSEMPYGYKISYVITDNDANISVRFVDDPSSIATISGASQQGDVKYFDLNGMPVSADHLIHGTYIRLQDGKATKIQVQ
ncbi:MAG: hypothetical protein HDS08_02270 [Bacteroides sp.]|nr:hypothetical protein [Bacteroides sp.]